MTSPQWEIGKTYKTRGDGERTVLVFDESLASHCQLVVVDATGNVSNRFANGRVHGDCKVVSGDDLLPPTRVVYANVFETPLANGFLGWLWVSAADANSNANAQPKLSAIALPVTLEAVGDE